MLIDLKLNNDRLLAKEHAQVPLIFRKTSTVNPVRGFYGFAEVGENLDENNVVH